MFSNPNPKKWLFLTFTSIVKVVEKWLSKNAFIVVKWEMGERWETIFALLQQQ